MAEHQVWRRTHHLEPAVRRAARRAPGAGLKVGLVSNALRPPALMRELFAEIGLLDGSMRSRSRPRSASASRSPVIFEAALAQAGSWPAEAVMVGDRLREDVGGAQALGIATVQARWFRSDDRVSAEPDATRHDARRRAALARHNLKTALFVKSCGERTAAVTIPG